jgi:signal transduction histidine kinase
VKRLEAAVEVDDRERLGRIAHGIRAALTPLKGYLTMLAQGRIDPRDEDRAEMFEILLRQTDRLEQLAAELTEPAAPEPGRGRMVVVEGRATAG